MNDLHKLFGSLGARITDREIRIDEVLAYMVFQNLSDETLQGTATRRRLLKDPRAFLIALDGAFDRLNLALDALEAIQQLGPVSLNMRHL